MKSQNESSQTKPKILNFAANGAFYLWIYHEYTNKFNNNTAVSTLVTRQQLRNVKWQQETKWRAIFRLVTLVKELFLSASWTILHQISAWKFYISRRSGTGLKEPLSPKMLLKTEYNSSQIRRDVGPCENSTICRQIYVLKNVTLANRVDLVGVYIHAEKYKYRSLGNIFPLLGLLPDFRELILTLFNKFVDVGPYKFLTRSNTKCVFWIFS